MNSAVRCEVCDIMNSAVRCEVCDIHEQCRKPEVLLLFEVDREDPITDCESFLSEARTPPLSAPVRDICHTIDH